MPGCERHSLESMVKEAKDAWSFGVKSFIVFPKVPDEVSRAVLITQGVIDTCIRANF